MCSSFNEESRVVRVHHQISDKIVNNKYKSLAITITVTKGRIEDDRNDHYNNDERRIISFAFHSIVCSCHFTDQKISSQSLILMT